MLRHFMRFSTQVIPISYLKSHAAEIIDTITENRVSRC